MKSQEDTACVLVLYRPPETLRQAVKLLAEQVKCLILVDNGNNEAFFEGGLDPSTDAPPAATRRPLGGEEGSNIFYIKCPENNLARAQNLGIVKARELRAEFVLLMDDDSLPAADMVQKLREAWQLGIGVVGPYLQEPELGREPHYIQHAGACGFRRVGFQQQILLRDLFYVAASGSLIPLEVIDNIGGMEETLGIYFVDTEFCLRARAAGYDVAATREATMQHRFGAVSQHRLLGRIITTTNHSAATREKMFRNRKILWKRYWRNEPGYVLFDLLRAKSECLRVLLFEADKKAKLAAMLRGLLTASA